ncbi:MAG: LacI family DNA-binding transcriptional regulator [Anaerolineae bacterium]|nr:LacI family DNA-binding transcriptional regulator [Anaerolineae bacterium]
MPPNMEDVAQRAGVSKATVSLVLNKKPGISPETQRVVLLAAEELAYRLPERRPLRSSAQRTLTIIYHLKDVERTEAYNIIPGFLKGARMFAQEAGVHLTILAGDQQGEFGQIGSEFLDAEGLLPEGLLLMGPALRRDSQSVVQALKRGIPAVVLCRNWPDMPVSTVGHNHHEQAGIALDHLAGLGHRTIAFLAGETDAQYDWCQWRLGSYRGKMVELNGEVDEDLIILSENRVEAIKALVRRRPDVTAIFANHDTEAIEAMEGLVEAGLRIPQDVSVIGQDDARQPPAGLPRLTTVRFSHAEVGYLAAELLLKQIESNEVAHGNIWVRSYLVERESCCGVRPA